MGLVIFPLIRQQQYGMVIAPPIFSLFSIVAVALRFTARRLANRRPDSSDYILLVALILSVVYSGLNMAECIIGGGGLHVAEIVAMGGSLVTFQKVSLCVIPAQALMNTLWGCTRDLGTDYLEFLRHQMGLVAQVLWSMTVTCVKISILVLYCKLFPLTWFTRAAHITGLACVGYTVGTILAAFLVCQPLPYYWDITLQGGHCGNEFLSYLLTGSINIATDVLVLVLPIPSLVRLEMALYKKLILVGTFACGLFTCVVGALRLRAIVLVDFNDYTYSIADAMTFSTIEPALAIVLACVPTLRPLLPSRTSSPAGTETRGGTSLKWKLHPSLITYGGSRKLAKKAGGSSTSREKATTRLDEHDTIESGSECELTIRPAGTAYMCHVARPRSEEACIVRSTNNRLEDRDIEMGVWVP